MLPQGFWSRCCGVSVVRLTSRQVRPRAGNIEQYGARGQAISTRTCVYGIARVANFFQSMATLSNTGRGVKRTTHARACVALRVLRDSFHQPSTKVRSSIWWARPGRNPRCVDRRSIGVRVLRTSCHQQPSRMRSSIGWARPDRGHATRVAGPSGQHTHVD